MREIKFRAKRKNNGEWICGYLCEIETAWDRYDHGMLPVEYGMAIIPTNFLTRGPMLVNGETIGQYTGLKDKNGVEIYEGDIVKFGKYVYQITHECGSFCLCDKQGLMIGKIGGMNDHCYSLMSLYLECCWEEDCAYDIKVIGNIYDNPELVGDLNG